MRTRVRKLTGVVMETLLTTPQLDLIINEAYLHICNLAEWTFLHAEEALPMVAGQTVYALPGAVKLPRSVDVTAPAADRTLLRPRPLEAFDRYPAREATAGVPWGWAVRSDTEIEVFPPPVADVVLRVRGWKDVVPLAQTADVPVFAEEYHPIVSYDAAARVLAEEGDDSGRSVRYRAEVVSFLLRMGDRYGLPESQKAAAIYAAQVGEGPTADEREEG